MIGMQKERTDFGAALQGATQPECADRTTLTVGLEVRAHEFIAANTRLHAGATDHRAAVKCLHDQEIALALAGSRVRKGRLAL